MVTNSLYRYYQILSNDDKAPIPSMGYSTAKISYALILSPDGELLNVMDLRDNPQKGNKMQPISMIVPEQKGRSGTKLAPYFLCDNNKYTLGIDAKEKPERLVQLFDAFKNLHFEILNDISHRAASGLIKFLNSWDPKEAHIHPVFKNFYEEIISGTGSNLVFKLEGEAGYIHELPDVKNAWIEFSLKDLQGMTGQCLVTGEKSIIEKVHPKIKGVRDAQAAGASIVSFNFDSLISYGKEQSYNAPIGVAATFAYTTVLNYMLSNRKQKIQIGDTTTVFWAESPKGIYTDLTLALFNLGNKIEENEQDEGYESNKKVQSLIESLMKKYKNGEKITDISSDINPETKFCILGLSPNNARISVRFFYTDSFETFMNKMMQHYKDMEIIKRDFEPENIPLWQLIAETVPKTVKEKKASPLLGGAIARAIITGSNYPALLYNAIINRIRADQDINHIRMGVIKACLIRKARISNNQVLKEVLTMSLNESSTNTAYLLGRLFAVLEKAQQDANKGINTTIKDRYFTSACATPASVFPVLIRLAQHHIGKSDYGYVSDKRIGEIMNEISVFPSHLGFEEQGLFMLGYYHQRQSFYQKKEA